jgi:hypothetical protein
MSLFILAGVLLGAVPSDSIESPAALVSRLGAARYLDREAAETALRAQGTAALPALREAVKRANDPEVRSRASELVAKIENAAMLEPTRVRFSYPGTPLAEILKDLSTQSGIPLTLDDRGPPTDSAGDSLHLSAAEPIPFWEAIDRVASAAQLRVNFGVDHQIDNRGFGLGVRLSSASSPRYVPICRSGPFRLKIESIHHQRDRHFDQDAEAETDEQFYIAIQLMAEPRLLIRQRNAIHVLEAVDELGQDLNLPEESLDDDEPPGIFDTPFEMSETPRIDAQLFLKRPARSGTSVKSLKGTIPLHVVSRKGEPLEVPLQGSVGKSFSNDELTFTVRDVSRDPLEPETTVLLGVRRRAGSDADAIAEGAVPALASQFDSRNAQGRRLLTFTGDFVPAEAVGEAEAGITVTIIAAEDAGAPSHLQIYGLNHANVDIPFSFHDVPMP